MVSALGLRSSSPGLSPGWKHCVVRVLGPDTVLSK